MKYFFTYGSEGHPFKGGWTEVIADDMATAMGAFKLYHPDTGGRLSCCNVYREDTFATTSMAGPNGNFGKFCWERITISNEVLA